MVYTPTARKNTSKKRHRCGKKWRAHKELCKMVEEGHSKNSQKTGLKHGKQSKESIRKRRLKNSLRIKAAREAAERYWETYVVAAVPGELVKCQNKREAMRAKIIKYDLDYTKYVTQKGSVHLPCPPIFFDSNSEKGYLQDIEKNPIFCGLQPHFLIHKFVNVLSDGQALRLRKQWEAFMRTNPVAHNTDESSSARSSGTASYHLGLWRRSSDVAFITVDSRCESDIHQLTQCKNFLRSVKGYVASTLKRLMSRYTKEEWVKRKVMAKYIRDQGLIDDYQEMDFKGAFTTVSVTNGVSDIMHTDRNDGGITWVVPIGEWEGGDLCFPQFGISIPIKQGEAIAFQANFLAHMSSILVSGDRLALTCFTDRNILLDSQK